jgi:hypothetical protein
MEMVAWFGLGFEPHPKRQIKVKYSFRLMMLRKRRLWLFLRVAVSNFQQVYIE